MEQVITLTLQMLGFGRTKLQGNLGGDRPSLTHNYFGQAVFDEQK
jgi:hypothetical protein